MAVTTFLATLGPEIEDPEEESFLIFSQSIPSQDLGFVDAKAKTIDLTIGGRDLTIHQSPTILTSTRTGGTTGAVVWRISPFFAIWISSPENVLFRHGLLSSSSSVIELGCGISGIIALTLGTMVQQYVLTDQQYVMKYLQQNLLENSNGYSSQIRGGKSDKVKSRTGSATHTAGQSGTNIVTKPLDWETDEVSSSLFSRENSGKGFDIVIACDCIYNDALIKPFVQTCKDICELRNMQDKTSEMEPTMCIIAQQLRSADVFEEWLKAFHEIFHIWRLPDESLTSDLASNSGFIIHIGILR